MKRFSCLFILIIAGLLILTANNVSSQTLTRYTTTELLNRAKINGAGFTNSYPEQELNYTLPLIDSAVALELTKLSGLHVSNNYTYAISLQCRNDSLKQMVLNDLLVHDKFCKDTMISKIKYDDHSVAGVYEYGRLSNAMLAQTDKEDTGFLKIANKEFEYWAPMAKDYMDTIMKSGMHQLAIKSGKRKFTPCMLASPGNCSLWVACIYYITGKKEYGSANEQVNEVYRKLMKKLRIDKKTDNRKGVIHYGKEKIITPAAPVISFNSLDFEMIPELKEKFDNVRKKASWEIIIYTNGNKALLLLYDEEKMMSLSKREIAIKSMYLIELTSPSEIHLTNIDYGQRY